MALTCRGERRPVRIRSLRGRLHLLRQFAGDVLLAAFEESFDLRYVGPVLGLADVADTRRLAALDVVQQARPFDRLAAFVDVEPARPEREEPPDQIHRLVDAARRRVRPEIAAAIGRQLARAFDLREVVGQRDLDERVALVVL